MPTKIEPKAVDHEADLSAVQRTYQKLAPECSLEKRAGGVPQLAPQEKQIGILTNEMDETLLCINLASKGQHAVRDARIRKHMRTSIVQYEELEAQLRDERAQQNEVDCLNYLAQKNVIDLLKTVPSQFNELAMLENALNRLRRMENRLDLTTKRFCIVNTDNKRLRDEINRLLIERKNFNIQWKRTINKLVQGKEYLMDIFEIATGAFASREEWCRKLETLKWKGLFQLNKDIMEMQGFDGELNHLAKLEEFLRVKGSRRFCEADEIEEQKRLEEKERCEQEVERHHALLEGIFAYTGISNIATILKIFNNYEICNHSMFILLCEVMQQSIVLKKELEEVRQKILDAYDGNESRIEKQDNRILDLTTAVAAQQELTHSKQTLNNEADASLLKVIKGVDELISMAKCNHTPLLSLLGNHKDVTRWNVHKFLGLLELEIKSLIQIAYNVVKPPEPTPTPHVKKGKVATEPGPKKIIADPHVEALKPNKIEILVPYQPCAYCVEDYIMNLVCETPAVPADKEYIEHIFHLQDVNTKFGIYTLTVPEKRHAYRDVKRD